MKFFILTFFIGLSLIGFTQDFASLQNLKLESESDFRKYERTLIKAVNHNFEHSINEELENRLLCSRFITRFASGVPYITISLGNPVLKLTDKNPDLLILFMGLWMKSSIEKSNYSKEEHKLNVYTQLGKYCLKGNGVKKTCSIRKLKRATKKDKVKKWMTKHT